MRPTSWTTAFLACAVRAAFAGKGQDIVTFAYHGAAAEGDGRIFLSTDPNQFLSWSLQPGFGVDKIELWNSDGMIGQWPIDNKAPASKANRGFQKRDSNVPIGVTAADPSLIPLNVTGNSLFFNFTTAGGIWESNIDTKPLYAQLSWSSNEEAGFTSTDLFAVASSQSLVGSVQSLLEKNQGIFPAPATSTTTTSMYGHLPTSTGSPPNPSAPASPTNAVTAASASGGLNSGAIAGIVVGAVVGLALVGALVWFFCFRRRKQHSQTRGADYSHDAGTHAMMVDKEVPGVSESSPHSAYGDDGGRLHDRSSTAMDSSYAPYSDHASASVAHASPVASHVMTSSQTHLPQHGTRSPTPPATTQYAHLVEEGMTADEIRRLEEEERALDQAIEAAGTHRPAH